MDLAGVTFVARTFDVGDPDYAVKQKTLNAIVATVRFDDDVPGTEDREALKPSEDDVANNAQFGPAVEQGLR